jgi:hypothetical protein
MTIFSDTRSVPVAEATREAVLASTLLGLAVTATLSSSTRSDSTSGQLAMAAGRVGTAAPESAAIKIAPASVVVAALSSIAVLSVVGGRARTMRPSASGTCP